jgi:hypothetical protein
VGGPKKKRDGRRCTAVRVGNQRRNDLRTFLALSSVYASILTATNVISSRSRIGSLGFGCTLSRHCPLRTIHSSAFSRLSCLLRFFGAGAPLESRDVVETGGTARRDWPRVGAGSEMELLCLGTAPPDEVRDIWPRADIVSLIASDSASDVVEPAGWAWDRGCSPAQSIS